MINSPEKIEKNIEALRAQTIVLEQGLVQYRRAKLAKEQEIQQLIAQEMELKDNVETLTAHAAELADELTIIEESLAKATLGLDAVQTQATECKVVDERLQKKIKDTFDLWL